MIILGIETSCDETAASILEAKYYKKNLSFRILSNVVFSQISIHQIYGGVVPEVAARAHLEKILPVIKRSLVKINPKKIDAIAVTNGPGLITSLLVGVEAAKTLSYIWHKPLLPVNHLMAHIYANWLPNSKSQLIKIPNSKLFPAICLVVSGGHTKIFLMKNFEKFKEIGSTRDDAAGECFDKIAKLLNLGYPGGPAIAKEATKFKSSKTNLINHNFSIKLPRPMIKSDDFDFSFSGLKTAVLYLVKQNPFLKNKKYLPLICRESQQAIIDVLISKTIRATKKFKAKSIFLGGGVTANKELRKQLRKKIKKEIPQTKYYIPKATSCTDNAAMVAIAGYFKYKNLTSDQRKTLKQNWRRIKAKPNLD